MRNAMYCAALSNDVVVGVVAIDSDQCVSWTNLTPNAQSGGVVLLTVGGKEDGTIYENCIAVGSVGSVVVGVVALRAGW